MPDILNPSRYPPSRLFLHLFWVTLAIKLLLATALPLTGDEAYFFLWGRHPALGYYDHPPMIGWWLTALMSVGDALWWLRMPSVLLSHAIALGIVLLLRERDQALAWLTGSLYLVAPMSLLGVLITTDTPVILFSFLTVFAFDRAVRGRHFAWFAAAGLFLGLAMLSKYFAGLLALALVAYLVVAPDRRRTALGLLLVTLLSSALFSINLYWNYTHCLDNFLFNFITRNRDLAPWYNPLVYLATLVYVVTPPVAWYLLRGQGRPAGAGCQLRLFLVLNLVPYGLLGLLSLAKLIGLHWLLGFYAFSFVLLALLRGSDALRGAIRFNLWFSGVHLALVLVLLLLPWQSLPLGPEQQKKIIDATRQGWVWEAVRPLAEGRHLFTRSYAGAGEMAYYAKRPVGVFGQGSFHAREDDKHTRFDRLDGADFLIFQSSDRPLGEYTPYFDRVEVRTIDVHGAKFNVVLGDGFRYPVYREKVLKRIDQRFYRIPEGWPVGACYFKERYGFP